MGQVFSAFVDGTALATYKVEGTEQMGNGTGGSSGPGSIVLYATQKNWGASQVGDGFAGTHAHHPRCLPQ